jgi:hypothetical protein
MEFSEARVQHHVKAPRLASLEHSPAMRYTLEIKRVA